MTTDLDHLALTLGGRPVHGSWDRIRRYCGIPWSGGPPETWAFPYYDALAIDPDTLEPVDVLATSALHNLIPTLKQLYAATHTVPER
jgi:hypothetical protein